MQVSVDTTSQIERRVKVQVPAAEIDEAVTARLKDAAKTVRMDGFRKGKVPMSVIRQRYGSEVRNEVVGEVMRERYVRAITDENLNPAGNPQIETDVNEAGKDLEFTATLEIYPEVELSSIEGTEVERPVVEVADADVAEMIETLRKQNASWEEVERAAEDGDQLTIDFQGYLGDEPFEGGSAEGHELVIGSGSFIPGFEEQLIGAKPVRTRSSRSPSPRITRPSSWPARKRPSRSRFTRSRLRRCPRWTPSSSSSSASKTAIWTGSVRKSRRT